VFLAQRPRAEKRAIGWIARIGASSFAILPKRWDSTLWSPKTGSLSLMPRFELTTYASLDFSSFLSSPCVDFSSCWYREEGYWGLLQSPSAERWRTLLLGRHQQDVMMLCSNNNLEGGMKTFLRTRDIYSWTRISFLLSSSLCPLVGTVLPLSTPVQLRRPTVWRSHPRFHLPSWGRTAASSGRVKRSSFVLPVRLRKQSCLATHENPTRRSKRAAEPPKWNSHL